ncbi:MAG: hypothetical protein V4731_08545 [Pseudomonadota bacterium]
MAQLSLPVQDFRSGNSLATQILRLSKFTAQKLFAAFTKVWAWACEHAERSDRVVPYY